ncbi:MAG TPA: hypothetical protein VE309_12150 [Caulobacteraceae bacterium]|nr:hypothetical protein [Caulobacteraceae bacterium]
MDDRALLDQALLDRALLDGAIARLKATGVIEYTGEFGCEITTFIPFVGWLKAEGLLEGRRVLTYAGMRPYYYFLGDGEYGEKAGDRHWIDVQERGWPTNSTYTATRQPWHAPPDYRSRYRGQGPTFARPVLFVQNKFCLEWGRGPINFLPLNLLARLLSRASARFDIVYSRPRPLRREVGFTPDNNAYCDYPDIALVREHPNVTILEDLCERTGAPYNLTKLEILAKSNLFVAVQGGGAHLLACFGNSLILLLHYIGDEDPHAYQAGPYKYLANPAPTLLLARDHARMESGVDLICAFEMTGGVGRIDARYAPVLKALQA